MERPKPSTYDSALAASASPSRMLSVTTSRAFSGRQAGVIDGPKGAATLFGLHPKTLRSRIKRLGIERTSHDGS
jgi:hypothetical protein